MISNELLEAVPLAILTGLGAYGGFPQPPRWWQKLSNFKLMNFIVLWILIYQGGGRSHAILTSIISILIFTVMEVSKYFERKMSDSS